MRPIERIPQPDDQEKIDQAADLLLELAELNPQIDPNMWVSAFSTLIASSYRNTGFTSEEFKIEMERMINHYQQIWNNQEVWDG